MHDGIGGVCAYVCVSVGGGMAHFSVSLCASAAGENMSFLTAASVAAHVFIHSVSS